MKAGCSSLVAATFWRLLCSNSGWVLLQIPERRLESPPAPFLSAAHVPLPELPTQCSAGPQLQGQVVRPDKDQPLPGPIKPPAFPAFQPSLSLGSPISSGARCTRCSGAPRPFLTLQGLLPRALDSKVSRGACASDGDRGVVEACWWMI